MLSFTHSLRTLFVEMIPRYLGTAHSTSGTKIQTKDDGTPYGDLDRHALRAVRELIGEHFPRDLSIGEEDENSSDHAAILAQHDRPQWTIDGLDGTGNFRMGTASFGAAVSRRYGDTILYAAHFRPVDEVLYRNGFFYAGRGEGACQWCGECGAFHRVSTGPAHRLERTVVMLEGSSKKFFHEPVSTLGKAITTRASFSSCIAATTVAQGLASALVTVANKPWDNWPSWLLIEEAGGSVTDWNGNPCTPEQCENMIAAATEKDRLAVQEFLTLCSE